MKKLLSIVMAMIFAMQLSAQTVVVAGDTLSNQMDEYLPINHCYHDSYAQLLYKAEELQAGGIMSISFYVTSNGFNNGTVKIYMKEVETNTISGITPGTDYTEVYSGADITTNGWVTFNFNAPFVYSGTSNLLVSVIRDGNAYNCGGVLYKVSTVANTSYVVYDDGVSFDVATMPAGWPSGGEYRPVAKFDVVDLEGFCYPPTNLTVETASITTSEATISWNTFDGTTTQFGLAYKSITEEDWNTVGGSLTDSSYTISGLDPYTRYQVKVWSICDGENSSEKITEFVTLPTPDLYLTLPYSQNFDDMESVSEWYFVNNTPNKWYIASAVNNTYDEDGLLTTGNALYVSNDGGLTNFYDIEVECNSHAYTLINIEEGNYYGVSLDVKLQGESSVYEYDYLAISIVPLVEELGSILPSANRIIKKVLSTDNQWERINIPFPNDLEPSVYKLVFSWHNDAGVGDNPPAAVDNVSITSTPCARVNDFEVSMEDAGESVTVNVAVVDSLNDGAEYLVEYRYAGDTTWHTEQSESPVVITDVPYSSRFDYRVTSVCSGDYAITSDMFTEWTLCHSIPEFPYIENFDTNIIVAIQDSARANLPSLHCWYNINAGSEYYYWSELSSGMGVDSTKAMYFSGTTSSDDYNFSDWLISPMFELTGNERLNFQYKIASNTNYPVIDVYAMNVSETDYTAMADTASFTLLTSISTQNATAGNYNEAEIFLNQFEGNTRIAFAVRQKSSTFYIDNFAISELPACPNVYGFSPVPGNQVIYVSYDTGNITEDGVTVAYAEIEEGQEFDPTSATTITIPADAELPYVIEGMTTGSTYAFAAQQACGGNWTETVIVTIPTAYIPPVSFDFDTPETTPELTITTNNPSVSWFVGTAANNTVDAAGNPTTGGALYVSADNGVTPGYNSSAYTTAVASLLVALDAGLETHISLDYKVDGDGYSFYNYIYGYDYMNVYLVPFGATRNSSHLLAEYLFDHNYWGTLEATIPSTYYGLYRLEFVWISDTYGEYPPAGIVDNIEIIQTSCVSTAASFTVTPLETEEGYAAVSVNVTDQVNEGAIYTVRYKPSTATEYTEVTGIAISDFPVVISDGIDFQTIYDFQVLLLCAGEEMPTEVGTQTVTIPCQATTAPWFEDFSEDVFVSPSCWDRYSGLMPANGIIPQSSLNPATTYWFINERTIGGVTSNALRANIYGESSRYWAVSPTINLENDGEIKQIAFDVAVTKYGENLPPEVASDDKFAVLVSLDNGATWNTANALVFADGDADTVHNYSNLTNQYQRYAYKLVDENDEPLTGQVRFAFYGESTVYNGDNDLFVDNISVGPWSECQAPYGITISSITSSTATASFQTWGEATTWEYVVVEGSGEEVDLDGATPVQVSTTDPIALTELDPLTVYTFAIRSVCEESSSPWAIATFTTMASGEPVPYSTSFDDADDVATWFFTNNASANLWAIGTATSAEEAGSAAYISTDNGATYSASVVSNTTVSYIWKDFAFGEGDDAYELSFDWKIRGRIEGSSAYNGIVVYLTDLTTPPTNEFPSNEDRITLLYGSDDWTNESVYLGNVTGDKRLVFLTWGYTSADETVVPAAIDNISISISTCTPPATPTLAVNTADIVTVTWEDADETHTSWNVYYKSEDDEDYTMVTVSTPTITLPEVTPSTTYSLYVKTNCGAEESVPTSILHFATPCETETTFPYAEGFEATEFGCWTNETIAGSQSWTLSSIYSALNDVNPAEGSKYALYKTTSYNGNSARLISPIFDLSSLTSPYIKLSYINDSWGSDQDVLKVQYRTTAAEEWIDLATYSSDVSSWATDSIALPNPSSTYQIAFHATSYYGYGVGVDAVQIYDAEEGQGGTDPDPEPQPCDAPTALAASNITETSAEITWNGTASTYEFKLNGGTAETLTTTTKSLTDLTPNTTYTVEVRAVCEDQQSAWVTTTFTTLAEQGGEDPEPQPCDAPTNLSASNITETTAEITWTGTAEAYEFKLNSGAAETLTTTTKSLTDLTPNTAYTVEVRAICGEQTSDWVSTTFTTLEQIVIVLAEVTTTPATEVGNTSATLNGALVNAGNSENIAVGFALATVADFTLEDANVQNITATLTDATFSQVVTDLVEGQTYFYRAYATNEAGTAYGAVETFTLSGLTDALANAINAVVYPNPATSQATLEINGLNQDAKIVISDLQGRILSQDQINAGETRYTINVSEMTSGVYYIRIVTDSVVSTQKLIVE